MKNVPLFEGKNPEYLTKLSYATNPKWKEKEDAKSTKVEERKDTVEGADALYYLVNCMYTLRDKGITRDSSLEEVNDVMEAESNNGGIYDSIEEFHRDWDKFVSLAGSMK